MDQFKVTFKIKEIKPPESPFKAPNGNTYIAQKFISEDGTEWFTTKDDVKAKLVSGPEFTYEATYEITDKKKNRVVDINPTKGVSPVQNAEPIFPEPKATNTISDMLACNIATNITTLMAAGVLTREDLEFPKLRKHLQQLSPEIDHIPEAVKSAVEQVKAAGGKVVK